MTQGLATLLVLVLTFLSGLGDAEGFLHASRVWNGQTIIWDQVAKSALGFAFGVVTYWGAATFMNRLGVVSPEIQTLVWFAVTIITVAVLSGNFMRWQLTDRIVAGLVLTGIGWLVWRTGQG
jgi:hypothetical protein